MQVFAPGTVPPPIVQEWWLESEVFQEDKGSLFSSLTHSLFSHIDWETAGGRGGLRERRNEPTTSCVTTHSLSWLVRSRSILRGKAGRDWWERQPQIGSQKPLLDSGMEEKGRKAFSSNLFFEVVYHY